MGYGTGAIMAVPAHDERDFEFCRKYGIPIRPVIRPVDGELADGDDHDRQPFTEYGIVENSGEWSGLPSAEARARNGGLRQANMVSAKPRSPSASKTGAFRGSATGARPFRSSIARMRDGSGAGEQICR